MSAGRIQAGSRRLASRKRRCLLQGLRGVAAIQCAFLSIYLVLVRSCRRCARIPGGWARSKGLGIAWRDQSGVQHRRSGRPQPPTRVSPIFSLLPSLQQGILIATALSLLLPWVSKGVEPCWVRQDPFGSTSIMSGKNLEI